MATFLQLCQALGRESSTAGTGQPASVVGQSGRLAKFVAWVSDAWVEIQDSREGWFFLRKDFLYAASIGTMAYTSASFNIADWGKWVGDRRDAVDPEFPVSIYDPAIGAADEGTLIELDWKDFRQVYVIGAQTNSRPQHYAIAPDGTFNLGPKPDKAYMVRGAYVRTAQVLAANADIPICPPQHHNVILFMALTKLYEADEAPLSMQTAARRYESLLGDLRRDQLPRIRIRRGAMA